MTWNRRLCLCLLLLLPTPDGWPAGVEPPSADGLMPAAEIAEATFVPLAFDRFPELPPHRVPATAIHVSERGLDLGAGTAQSPFRTLARAVRAAGTGATIVVHGGTYVEAWQHGDYRALVLNRSDLTLMAHPGDRVTMKPAAGITHGIVVNARGLVVRGIDLHGFADVGILFDTGRTKSRRVVIADLEINGSEEAIAMWEAEGAVDQLLLANLRTDAIIHCGVGPCSSWRLEHVTIDARGEGWGADAFAVESGDNILLVDVTVLGAGSDGIDLKATRVVVLDSRVEGARNNALKLWHGGDVINTVIRRGQQNPVVVEEGRFRLLHSTIGYPPEQAGRRDYSMILGYDLRRPMRIEIVNSIVANPSGGAWINPESTSVSIRNSLFYTADGSETLIHGDLTVDYNEGAAGIYQRYGAGNLAADPRLNDDLSPADGSPAIDAGVALPVDFPRSDIRGKPRFLGAAPDLGAFESGSPATPSLPGPRPQGPRPTHQQPEGDHS